MRYQRNDHSRGGNSRYCEPENDIGTIPVPLARAVAERGTAAVARQAARGAALPAAAARSARALGQPGRRLRAYAAGARRGRTCSCISRRVSYTRSPPGKRPLMSPDPFPGFLLSAQPCRPTSRGSVTLRSPDPLAAAGIAPNSLADRRRTSTRNVEGTRFLRSAGGRAGAWPASSTRDRSPDREVRSRRELLEDIRQRASSVFHPVSTCRMGPDAQDRGRRSPAEGARPRGAAHRRRLGLSRR